MKILLILTKKIKIIDNNVSIEDVLNKLPFELQSSGWSNSCVLFMGIVIWDSDNDERKFNEELNDYEPLKDHLIRESLKITKTLNKTMKIFKKHK